MIPPAAGATVVPVQLAQRHCPPDGSAFPAYTHRPGKAVPLNPLPSRWDSKGLSPLAAGGLFCLSFSRAPYRRIHLRRRE